MNTEKSLDVICLGRAAVDLYSQQIGARLEDVRSFAKYIGGSSCNIACGTSRLGLKSSMLTRVGDEHMGRFVKEELVRNGVDTSHVVTDSERLTALAILGIKDQDTFPLVFYRNDCADMAVDKSDFSEEYIASSKALLITGTHLSTSQTYETSKQAIKYAKANDTKFVLDIDYRPVLWGLSSLGDGETRFVSSESVSSHLQSILPDCDLIVGTEEEIHIAGGTTDTIAALNKIRTLSNATIVLKLGPLGCTVLNGDIPNSESDFVTHGGFNVEVLNVLGAGDAFMSGFLRGWLRQEGYEKACQYANASGALVVSRHGCTPAIPSEQELFDYIERAGEIKDVANDVRTNHLHRVTTRAKEYDKELYILAFDHRKQLFDMATDNGRSPAEIPKLKRLITKAVTQASEKLNIQDNIGVLIDDTYGQDSLNFVTGKNWWIGRPVELPSSRPIELEGGRNISARLTTWPTEHIVKCLVFFHPEDELELRLLQERQIKELYQACLDSGHDLLLEIIPPADMPQDEFTVVNVMKRIYNLNVHPEWWKLPSPSKNAWREISELIETRSPLCHGVVLLGLDAPFEELAEGFKNSADFPICKGFAVGRTITGVPCQNWLAEKINDEEFIDAVIENYQQMINLWHQRKD